MSTSRKIPATIRQGGPGASHENAKAPLEIPKPPPAKNDRRSKISGGGGEPDKHHAHNPKDKGGIPRPPGDR